MANGDTEGQNSASTRIPGLIPHFYYDLIGRILPGAYLITGLVGLAWDRPELHGARCYLKGLNGSHENATLPVAILTVGLLGFVASAYLFGFIFGAAAFTFEKCLRRGSPMVLHELLSSFGVSKKQEEQLKAEFKEQFNFDLTETAEGNNIAEDVSKVNSYQQLTESSTLCSYYVWANSPNLGYMTSRWDAETLASRSVFAASFILAILRSAQMALVWCRYGSFGSKGALIIFGTVTVIAFFQYKFQRRKQIQGRFTLFQALRSILHSENAQ